MVGEADRKLKEWARQGGEGVEREGKGRGRGMTGKRKMGKR